METNKKQIKFTNVSKVSAAKAPISINTKVNTLSSKPITNKTATKSSKIPFQHNFNQSGMYDQLQTSTKTLKNIISSYGDIDN
jgi:hypothetical protein